MIGTVKEIIENLQKHENQKTVILASLWYPIDVIENAKGKYDREVTEQEAIDVLRIVARRHDANVGINWEILDFYTSRVLNGEYE